MDELRVIRSNGEQATLNRHVVDAFRQSLRGRLFTKADADYDQARALWNGAIDKHPALIARCSGVADVINAVNFAREQGLLLAVRGGAHNVAGKALCEGGLVIDLSGMRAVRVDPASRTAWVQGGATLRDLDHETQAFGLAAPVGVVSATGVGGLTLHGGYGWLTRRFGLTIDNLNSMDVVTADGSLVHASAEENPDLFWALRGGGGDFGVVTNFEFRLHPVGPKVWFGLTLYPLEKAGEALRMFRDYMAGAPEELGALGVFWNAPDEASVPEEVRGKPVFLFLSCYTGPLEKGEQALRPLREFGKPLADMSAPMPFEKVQQALDPDYPDGRQYYWKSVYLTGLSDGAIDVLMARAHDRPSPLSSVDIWGLGGAVSRVPLEETPFGMRGAPILIGIEANWDDPAQSRANIDWARRLFAELQPFSAGGGYLNFPGLYEEGGAMIKGAYGDNLDRLKAIKARYDPQNLFHGPLGHA